MANEAGRKGKLTTTQIILIAGFAAILIAGAVIFFLLTQKEEAPPEPAPIAGQGTVVYTEDNPPPEEPEGGGTFFTYMNTTWRFPDSNTASPGAVLGNNELNPTDLFVTLLMADGTEIYRSPTIPPGAEVEDITLTVDLDPGTYECIAVHHVLYEDGTEETQINMGVTIVVEA